MVTPRALAPVASSAQRIAPAQSGKAGEVHVGRMEPALVLDGERGEMRVSGEVHRSAGSADAGRCLAGRRCETCRRGTVAESCPLARARRGLAAALR